MGLLSSALEAGLGFFKNIFSFSFWKETLFGAAIAGATRAIASFIDTAANVAINTIKDMLTASYKRLDIDEDRGVSPEMKTHLAAMRSESELSESERNAAQEEAARSIYGDPLFDEVDIYGDHPRNLQDGLAGLKAQERAAAARAHQVKQATQAKTAKLDHVGKGFNAGAFIDKYGGPAIDVATN